MKGAATRSDAFCAACGKPFLQTAGIINNTARALVGLQPPKGTAEDRRKLRAKFEPEIHAQKQKITDLLVELSKIPDVRHGIIQAHALDQGIRMLCIDVFNTHKAGNLLVANEVRDELSKHLKDTMAKIMNRQVPRAGQFLYKYGYQLARGLYMVSGDWDPCYGGDAMSQHHDVVDEGRIRDFPAWTKQEAKKVVDEFHDVFLDAFREACLDLLELSRGEKSMSYALFNHVYWLTKAILTTNKPGCLAAAMYYRHHFIETLKTHVIQAINDGKLPAAGKKLPNFQRLLDQQIAELEKLWSNYTWAEIKEHSKQVHRTTELVDEGVYGSDDAKMVDEAVLKADKEEQDVLVKKEAAAAKNETAKGMKQGKAEKAASNKAKGQDDPDQSAEKEGVAKKAAAKKESNAAAKASADAAKKKEAGKKTAAKKEPKAAVKASVDAAKNEEAVKKTAARKVANAKKAAAGPAEAGRKKGKK